MTLRDLLERVEEQWRPYSSDEAAWFQSTHCDLCVRDAAYRDGTGDSCPIAAQGFGVSLGLEPPPEWVDVNGDPTCTAMIEQEKT